MKLANLQFLPCDNALLLAYSIENTPQLYIYIYISYLLYSIWAMTKKENDNFI